MATREHDLSDVPSIRDLLWDADRRSLDEFDSETRALLEQLGEAVFEAWPEQPEPEFRTDLLEDSDDWPGFVRELAGAGVKVEPDDNPDAEAIVAAVKKTIEAERAEGEKDATIPSRANTAQRKAMRLLLEQRVSIKLHDPQVPYVLAEVRGDNGVYTCGHHPSRNGWRCTCPEPRGNCSHVAAVKMVVPL
jgi:hypothetical protein